MWTCHQEDHIFFRIQNSKFNFFEVSKSIPTNEEEFNEREKNRITEEHHHREISETKERKNDKTKKKKKKEKKNTNRSRSSRSRPNTNYRISGTAIPNLSFAKRTFSFARSTPFK